MTRAERRRQLREARKAERRATNDAAQAEAEAHARKAEERRLAETRRHQERWETLSAAEREAEIRRHVAAERARPERYRRDLLAGFRRGDGTPSAGGDPVEGLVMSLVREELGPAAAGWDEAALAAAARRALAAAGLAAPDGDEAAGGEMQTEIEMAAREACDRFDRANGGADTPGRPANRRGRKFDPWKPEGVKTG